ncbi:MAG TPA: helix-turn-helix transcriptional regulator, partial [Methanoregula sp.]|nr:helix-turn-helix transcriptional regulator [Methanoregula sp.]
MADPGSDKREAILNTALNLFVERGFYGTPTSLISKEAGVATGTLFFYFRTKEDLIDTLYLRIKAGAAAAMRRGLDEEETTQGRLRRIW